MIFGALVPLAVAATAWACGVLATLKTDATAVNPGQVLTVTGRNYSPSATFTPVEIRWQSRTGELLKSTPARSDSSIETTVEVPRTAAPGWYVLNAVQYSTSTGAPKSGTPGRSTVRVQGAAAGAASSWGSNPGGGTAVKVGDAGPGSPALMPTLLGVVLSIGLLGGGLTLVSRSRTRRASRALFGV